MPHTPETIEYDMERLIINKAMEDYFNIEELKIIERWLDLIYTRRKLKSPEFERDQKMLKGILGE